MSRTKRQMQRLLDRYTDLQNDFEDWLRKNINRSRCVRDDERSGQMFDKLGVMEIRFKRPFKISRHFVVNKLAMGDGTKVFSVDGDREPYVEGGVLRDITETIPLSHLTLKEQNALVRELDERGYFDDDRKS